MEYIIKMVVNIVPYNTMEDVCSIECESIIKS